MARTLHADPDLELPKLRCAPFHESLDVDPAGTAGAYDAFLFVEVPLPWDRDISTSEPFLTALGAGTTAATDPRGRRVRPQGLVPRPGADGWTRVLLFERPEPADDDPGDRAAPYARREWWVEPERSVDLCRAVVEADDAALAEFVERRVEVPDDVIDLFVCTHGKRDTCCGGIGAALHDQLAVWLDAPEVDGSRVRLWRTSHTGGHRFAATALTFPDGYAWAHLDVSAGLALLQRTDADVLTGHCRGVASLPAGPAQVADAAVLARLGWTWADAPRRASATAFDRHTLATTVRVDGELADGRAVAFEVDVELERHVPQITCGIIDGPEYAVEPAWRAAATRELFADV